MSANGHKKLRLLKVIVQPVLVLDDGETLEEKTVEPTAVPAADWLEYPHRLIQEIAAAEGELNGTLPGD